jgi:hypothetical protein
MKKVYFVLALAGLLFAFSASSQAQTPGATIKAYATVLTALTVNDGSGGGILPSGQPLEFGYVLPGIDKEVGTDGTVTGLPSGGPAGHTPETPGCFRVAGTADKEILVTVGAVPANLTGGGTLPISFVKGGSAPTNGMGIEYTSTGTATGVATETFAAGAITAQNLSATGYGWYYVGGKVSPAMNQVAGLYQADLTMTVVYTGN